jgi:Family of unknown function (DUF5519)
MSAAHTVKEKITAAVTSWPGVTTGYGARGEFAFKVGSREIGHLHGSSVAHFGFPKEVWAGLRKEGRIVPHPIFPDSPGLAARRIDNDTDVLDVIVLLRINYDRLVARHGLPAADEVGATTGR